MRNFSTRVPQPPRETLGSNLGFLWRLHAYLNQSRFPVFPIIIPQLIPRACEGDCFLAVFDYHFSSLITFIGVCVFSLMMWEGMTLIFIVNLKKRIAELTTKKRKRNCLLALVWHRKTWKIRTRYKMWTIFGQSKKFSD